MSSVENFFNDPKFKSRLSLRPLFESVKRAVDDDKPGASQLYGDLIKQVEEHPFLLDPLEDVTLLDSYCNVTEMLLSTIFPPTSDDGQDLYAVSIPFTFHTVFSSKRFQQLFLTPGSPHINIPRNEVGHSLSSEKLKFAYAKVLKKFKGYPAPDFVRSTYPYKDPITGLIKYLALEVDTRFVDVIPADEMPEIPEDAVSSRTNRMMPVEQLRELLPLSKFIFEGIAIVRIKDVTEEESISLMKNSLLHTNAFSNANVYRELQEYMQSLIGLKDIKIGITPFFKVNGHFVYSELHNSNSLLFKHFSTVADKDEVGECCQGLFTKANGPIVFETLDQDSMTEVEYLKYYYNDGGRSVIISPLKAKDELIGMLEIISGEPGELKASHIDKIAPAIPLFSLALEKSAESLNYQIDRVIKEKFTAVQPAVEWKFTEAAFNYILDHQENEEAKMERIVFDEVYPLYGAIDIRNSSVERTQAIQLDIIEQLQWTRAIVQKAQKEIFFPLLHEIEFKIDKYSDSASDILLSEDEIQIYDFLQRQIVEVFEHLRVTVPSLKPAIDEYFSKLDPQVKMIYHHRKQYEESIARVNETIARFVDKEQIEAQKVFPHYFERYVTDGVEFNVYIGQSITPRRKFDTLYLRNMKMWQLSVLAKAARKSKKLAAELTHPLETTQLILAHSLPLSISFRTAERKFDVDGAYNIRYEIIKKRIDKVHIKGSLERLTQPGKIAIVYSQSKEAIEYKEYIDFLQNKKLLKRGIEEFELEELQGVVGLKALRVEINYDEENKLVDEKKELSNLTSEQLIGK